MAVAAGPAERCADACEAAIADAAGGAVLDVVTPRAVVDACEVAAADPAGEVGVASVLDAVAAGCVLAASPAPADV